MSQKFIRPLLYNNEKTISRGHLLQPNFSCFFVFFDMHIMLRTNYCTTFDTTQKTFVLFLDTVNLPMDKICPWPTVCSDASELSAYWETGKYVHCWYRRMRKLLEYFECTFKIPGITSWRRVNSLVHICIPLFHTFEFRRSINTIVLIQKYEWLQSWKETGEWLLLGFEKYQINIILAMLKFKIRLET